MEKIISILSILIVLPILTLSSCDTSTAPPPTNEENLTEQTMDVVYDNVMTYQLSYIRSLQLSSGMRPNAPSGMVSKFLSSFGMNGSSIKE